METMKKTFTFLMLIAATVLFAQIPAGYYSTATGTGYTLKTQLFNKIKNHSDQGYNGLYTVYLTSDRDYYYENDGTVLDMYSEKPTGTDSYTFSATNTSDRCGNYSVEGDCYNREHIIPQSVFNSASPMVSDAHFIVPTDGKVNGYRSNYPHGMVGTLDSPPSSISNPTTNGSKLGNGINTGYAAGYTGIVFEPIDEFKGDIARMYFYFATRYENTVAGYPYDMFNGTSNQVFTNTFLEILKHWHAMDPVSQREIDRNNAVYNKQNNRNPFIDHPEYVTAVWGPMLSAPSFDIAANISVYPNPATNHRINIATETVLDEIDLISVNGQIIQKIKNPSAHDNTYSVENLPSGFYFMTLSAGGQSTTKKVIVN
jgi:endonuclease I